MVFLLHLLMMTATLLSLSTLDETSHGLEDLIGPSKVFQDEVTVVDLKEEVVLSALLFTPMALLDIFALTFSDFTLGYCSS